LDKNEHFSKVSHNQQAVSGGEQYARNMQDLRGDEGNEIMIGL
jgi:hypothetical protein